MIVISNKPFTAWGQTFVDPVVAAVMMDFVHHPEILSLKGDSYRSRDKKLSDHKPKSSPATALAWYQVANFSTGNSGMLFDGCQQVSKPYDSGRD